MTGAIPSPAEQAPLRTITRDEAVRSRFFDASSEITKKVFNSRADRLLIHGPVGTGKTIILLEKIRACCLKYPGIRCAILRSYRSWLTSAALVSWENKVVVGQTELVPDRVRPENRTVYRFRNGSVVDVAGLDDPNRVMSAEYDMIYLQEATEVSRATCDDVNGRLRNNRMPYQQLLMDCNPASSKHWLKTAFESGWCEHYPMRHRDNPAMFRPDGTATKFGLDYMKKLESYTGVQRRRKVGGEWVQADGVIYGGWDSAVNVVKRFKPPADWRRVWCVDFGFENPFSWGDWAIDHDGRAYLVKEIYLTHLLVEDAARLILEVTQGDPQPEAIICDHDKEDRATLERHLKKRTIAAQKSVLTGIDLVAARIKAAGDGKPRLFICENALVHEPDRRLVSESDPKPHNALSEIDVYAWKKTADTGVTKDEPEKKYDHAMDQMRYVVMYLDHGSSAPAESDYNAPEPDTAITELFGEEREIQWV